MENNKIQNAAVMHAPGAEGMKIRNEPGFPMQEGAAEGYRDERPLKVLTFTVGDSTYGIELELVTEIVGIQPITEVPEVPAAVKGIMNLRGRIVPVIDIRSKFGWEEAPYHDRTCIVILEVRDQVVGLIVEAVSEVVAIPRREILQPPGFHANAQDSYIKGIVRIGDQIKMILDCNRLLDLDEMDMGIVQ